jgi:hypothetical protein
MVTATVMVMVTVTVMVMVMVMKGPPGFRSGQRDQW